MKPPRVLLLDGTAANAAAAPLFVIGSEGGSGAAALKGDDFGLVSFSPAVSARLVRLRRQGATVDLPIIKRTHPAAVGCMTLIAVPIGAVLVGCAVLLAGITLAIDMLFSRRCWRCCTGCCGPGWEVVERPTPPPVSGRAGS